MVAVLQTQFLPALLPGVAQFIPDLILLVVVAWALLLEERWAVPLAFGAGLFIDLLSPTLHPLGLNALFFTLIAFVINLLTPNPATSTVIRSVPVALLAAAAYHAASLIADHFLGYNNFQPTMILQVVVPQVIIDAALMIVVFGLVRFTTRIKAS